MTSRQEAELGVLLAANEIALGPLPSVEAAVTDALDHLHRYPDLTSARLRGELAQFLGASTDRIVVGNGSSAILRDLIAMLAGPGDEVLYPHPSFAYYQTAIEIAGARGVAVPLTDHRIDLAAMAVSVSRRTKAMVVCNPNDPTGTLLGEHEIGEFLARVPRDVLVVFDEAYHEFATRVDLPDMIRLAETHPNVAVTRTFSKAYGLAALRCGYGLLPSGLATSLRARMVPFGVSTIAAQAAAASLTPTAQDELLARVGTVLHERDRLFDELRSIGLAPVKSEGNFVFVPTNDADHLALALRERAIVVYPVPGHGVRITVGTKFGNERIIGALVELRHLDKAKPGRPQSAGPPELK